jgi:hypothetical protein
VIKGGSSFLLKCALYTVRPDLALALALLLPHHEEKVYSVSQYLLATHSSYSVVGKLVVVYSCSERSATHTARARALASFS